MAATSDGPEPVPLLVGGNLTGPAVLFCVSTLVAAVLGHEVFGVKLWIAKWSVVMFVVLAAVTVFL